jgi:hypothetical protein
MLHFLGVCCQIHRICNHFPRARDMCVAKPLRFQGIRTVCAGCRSLHVPTFGRGVREIRVRDPGHHAARSSSPARHYTTARERATRGQVQQALASTAGSVGATFQAYIKTTEWEAQALSARNKVWWPAWYRIRDMWGDVDPNTIEFSAMSR